MEVVVNFGIVTDSLSGQNQVPWHRHIALSRSFNKVRILRFIQLFACHKSETFPREVLKGEVIDVDTVETCPCWEGSNGV